MTDNLEMAARAEALKNCVRELLKVLPPELPNGPLADAMRDARRLLERLK